MPEPFLYEQLDTLSQWGSIKKEIPDCVAQNLNQRYKLRPYQADYNGIPSGTYKIKC